jgi:hypothetical protein
LHYQHPARRSQSNRLRMDTLFHEIRKNLHPPFALSARNRRSRACRWWPHLEGHGYVGAPVHLQFQHARRQFPPDENVGLPADHPAGVHPSPVLTSLLFYAPPVAQAKRAVRKSSLESGWRKTQRRLQRAPVLTFSAFPCVLCGSSEERERV